MKKKAYLIYPIYYNYEGEYRRIGGIQTYIRNLSLLLCENGYDVVIAQVSKNSFSLYDGLAEVVGIKSGSYSSNKKTAKIIYKSLKSKVREEDLVVFCTEMASIRVDHRNTIYIQHGISWDMQDDLVGRGASFFYPQFLLRVRRMLQNFLYANFFEPGKKFVCVDYNYLNWLKTQRSVYANNLFHIPNAVNDSDYSEEPKVYNSSEKVKILFARRFINYRGSQIAIDALSRIVKDYGGRVEVTFSGEGPDETAIRKSFRNYNNVKFEKYDYSETLQFHKKFDIALIPSIASEGTSLSLIEAMRSGCVCICSSVGGMTSIIIDGYNGVYCQPNSEDLYNKICKVLDGEYDTQKISLNAQRTIIEGPFNFNEWKRRWREVLDHETADIQ